MVKQKQIISQMFAPGVREVAILCVFERDKVADNSDNIYIIITFSEKATENKLHASDVTT